MIKKGINTNPSEDTRCYLSQVISVPLLFVLLNHGTLHDESTTQLPLAHLYLPKENRIR